MRRREIVRIRVDRAMEGIERCLKKSKSFLDDTSKLITDGSLESALGLTIYALENLGKAKMIFDEYQYSLQEGETEIVFKDARKTFYEHCYKLMKASSLLDLSKDDEVMILSLALGDDFPDPVAELLVEQKLMKVKDVLERGHGLRQSGFHVDYDEKEDKWSELEISKEELERLIESAHKAIKNFEQNLVERNNV